MSGKGNKGDNQMTRRFIALAVVLMVLGMLASPVLAQEADTATVTVFHAVPAQDGFPADVYLNDELIISGFLFETASDPMAVPAGTAALEVFASGADPASDDPAVVDELSFEAGVDYSIVAQVIDESPILSVFRNDTSTVAAGEARLTVRQATTLPSLDVVIDGENAFTALDQAADASAELAAGSHTVTFRSNGDTLGEQSVELTEGRLTVLYAVGSNADDTFGVLVQTVTADQSAPGGVPTGTGGYKAGMDLGYVALVVATVLVAALAGLGVRGAAAKVE